MLVLKEEAFQLDPAGFLVVLCPKYIVSLVIGSNIWEENMENINNLYFGGNLLDISDQKLERRFIMSSIEIFLSL